VDGIDVGMFRPHVSGSLVVRKVELLCLTFLSLPQFALAKDKNFIYDAKKVVKFLPVMRSIIYNVTLIVTVS
jgi:hypothetical protein